MDRVRSRGPAFTVTASDVLERAIGEDKNGRDGVYVLLDLHGNPPLVEPVLLNSPAFSPFNRDRSLDSGLQ